MRRLIINADDFGFTQDVNAGIVQAHREGVLTSTTLMANGASFDDAVRLARENPTLDIGIHLVLVQGNSILTGKPLPEKPRALLSVLARGGLDVYAELKAQIEKIRATGLPISHFDSHKHTHLVPTVFKTVVRLAEEYSVPWVRLPLDFGKISTIIGNRFYRRLAHSQKVKFTDHFLGFQLTGTLTEETFAAALENVQPGVTEFMCHPGYLGNHLNKAPTRLKESRLRELEALISPRIRKIIERNGIELTPF